LNQKNHKKKTSQLGWFQPAAATSQGGPNCLPIIVAKPEDVWMSPLLTFAP